MIGAKRIRYLLNWTRLGRAGVCILNLCPAYKGGTLQGLVVLVLGWLYCVMLSLTGGTVRCVLVIWSGTLV